MPELVVIAEQLLAPVPGGTGRYTRELLRAMAATTPTGWELTSVVSGSGDAWDAIIPGVRGPRVLRLPRRALIAAWERGFPLWPGGDSVHAMTPLAPPRRRGRGLVVTVHDAVPWTHPETLTARGVAWHRKAITRAVRQADAVVVPTSAVATELARHVEITAPVRVVGEGVPPTLVPEPEPDAARAISERLSLPPRYVLAIGTIEPRKGFDSLVRAMAAPSAPPIPLLIVGQKGWGDADLGALADTCGLPAGRVRTLGAIDDTELAVVLRQADALAVPSLAEGFGLPVLEAMAVGVPVVHSDAPALVEVAGGAGLATRRGDPAGLATALRTVIDDTSRREWLVEAGQRRAEQFTWEGAARELWHLHLDIRQ